MGRGTKPEARGRRGVALLLVMVGLVVCTLLTAGFLATQGTSIGIARNERDAEECRFLAQTGLDMCNAQIRTKSDWRETMQPGKWLNNFALGNGTVTVTASSANGSSSFSSDPTQPVVLQATGSCNNRNFTLTSTVGPTGGGTVFRGGNFFTGQIIIGDSTSTALVDSYNSLVAPYSSAAAGSNATFWTDSTSSGALTVGPLATFKGSLVAGPTAVLTNVLNGVLGLLIPISNAPEVRTAGTPVLPNFAGQTANSSIGYAPVPGVYNTGLGAGTYSFQSGAYEINGNVTVGSTGKLTVPGNVNAILYITGNLTVTGGQIVVLNGGSLTIYCGGSVTVNGRMNYGGATTALQIIGTSSCANVTFSTGANMWGVVYAPGATVTMNGGQWYGAVVASTMTMKGSSQFHFDEATKNLRIDGLTGGSAPPGTADYSTSVNTVSN